MIEDLDAIIEARPGWRERWLLPLGAGLLLAAVLTSSFARLAPARSTAFVAPAPRARILANTALATGIRALELPRTAADLIGRTQFSGLTGLTSMDMSDGFRDLYRLPDGRMLIVIELPDPTGEWLLAIGNGLDRPVTVRGAKGRSFQLASTSIPTAIGWVADGMQYQVGGAGFTVDELIRSAEALR